MLKCKNPSVVKRFGKARPSSAKNVRKYHIKCQNNSKEQYKKWGFLFGNALNEKTHQLINNLENENCLQDVDDIICSKKRP